MVETTLCYLFYEKQVLMMYRNKKENDFHEGKWNGLGGKIEKGETALEGIRREVLEESGLIIKTPQLLGVCYFPSFDGEEELMYLYTATEFLGDLIECNEGDLAWIDKNQLLSLNVWESDQLFLPYVLRGECFIGVFQFDGKVLISHEIKEASKSDLIDFSIEKGSQALCEGCKKV